MDERPPMAAPAGGSTRCALGESGITCHSHSSWNCWVPLPTMVVAASVCSSCRPAAYSCLRHRHEAKASRWCSDHQIRTGFEAAWAGVLGAPVLVQRSSGVPAVAGSLDQSVADRKGRGLQPRVDLQLRENALEWG